MERCHPREKPLIGKWEASNGDVCPYYWRTPRVPKTLGSNPTGHHLWSPTWWVPSGPNSLASVLIPKLGAGRQVRMSITIREETSKSPPPSRTQGMPLPPSPRNKMAPQQRGGGRGPPEVTYFEPLRAPPVTAATQWRERASLGRS